MNKYTNTPEVQADLTKVRLRLLEAGYAIIPNRGKVPAVAGWNDAEWPLRELAADATKGGGAARVARWGVRFPDAVSTGVRIENGLAVIDVDIDNEDLADLFWIALQEVMPLVAEFAPTRFGGGEHKLALFCRLDGEEFRRIASKRFEDGETSHMVEVFGGKGLRGGRCSRQFGVDGVHSFNDDGSVAREYTWSDGLPALHELQVQDLPPMTMAQVFALIEYFEQLAIAGGWKAIVPPATEGGTEVYDIDDLTRFDSNIGGQGLDYAELCEAYDAHGDQLRVSSSFMAGRDGSDPSRCWVCWSDRHDCVGVWVYGDEEMHLPVEAKPSAILENVGEIVREIAAESGEQPTYGTPNWRERKSGGYLPAASLHNARIAIEACRLVCSEDTFHRRLFVGRGEAAGVGEVPAHVGRVTDSSIGALRVLLSDVFGVDFTEKHVRDAVATLAHENRFDPVCDMLDDAQANWDGIERLDRMAVEHFNCEDTELNRLCVRKTMIAAVARARQPGIKFDTILTMEAPEGLNKSSAWEALAGSENFSDESIIGKQSREVQEHLTACWIHENAELAGMRKAEVETVKAFASRTVDRARPAFGHFLIEQPRHSIDVGTTNGDEYLQSQTGNRRFWPIKVLASIDMAKLRRERLQLWGEAATAQAAGESLVLPERLWAVAAVEQEARRAKHPWEAILAELTAPLPGMAGYSAVHVVGDEWRVSTATIFDQVLRMPNGQLHIGHSKVLAEVMRALGWKRSMFKREGRVVKGYSRTVVTGGNLPE